MRDRWRFAAWGLALALSVVSVQSVLAAPFTVNARSAMVVDMSNGVVLYEKNADDLIAPASITKVLTLYIVFDAIREGRIRLDDRVEISSRAAKTTGSRMGVKAGTRVSLEELIKGMAVVSGNDACVAVAEHISGNVEAFVRKMNAKARELGMNSSRFMTPNGLPAKGQLTTARDIARLSIAYLRRFPDSLTIHSMQAYSYGTSSHHNANRLLATCPGVDGLKTGFVCASGYNITATARRGNTRILAVVLGAPTPGVRLRETTKLLEAGFAEVAPELADMRYATLASDDFGEQRPSYVRVPAGSGRKGKAARIRLSKTAKSGKSSRHDKVVKVSGRDKAVKVAKSSGKSSKRAPAEVCRDTSAKGGKINARTARGKPVKDLRVAEKAGSGKQMAAVNKTRSSRDKIAKSKDTGKSGNAKKSAAAQSKKPSKATRSAAACPSKKGAAAQKTKQQAKLTKGKDKG
ncbi:D-alanyl-D-alanine carboxypeptidase family protein [Syntrophobacter fumaroxidans]|uniref:Penicillin-binding protein 6. Serine peptidase. MEROPS family S11 n=1 Tax=Syntrophobacter fumaroxidans (strain DSM 10017 / MPOB) TaxID=335543 RepID=A0LQM5_SYNFM|nr:D-alanyl-D-alanine carboxypeptidase family protein [Syntrophobacter fumaroxidans]ABK19727.1 penicillin-binding protein 6. Serine peptidase. MEROPS family S11 [Syntrophobacter fumaroxidans MPOB]